MPGRRDVEPGDIVPQHAGAEVSCGFCSADAGHLDRHTGDRRSAPVAEVSRQVPEGVYSALRRSARTSIKPCPCPASALPNIRHNWRKVARFKPASPPGSARAGGLRFRAFALPAARGVPNVAPGPRVDYAMYAAEDPKTPVACWTFRPPASRSAPDAASSRAARKVATLGRRLFGSSFSPPERRDAGQLIPITGRSAGVGGGSPRARRNITGAPHRPQYGRRSCSTATGCSGVRTRRPAAALPADRRQFHPSPRRGLTARCSAGPAPVPTGLAATCSSFTVATATSMVALAPLFGWCWQPR